MDLKFRIDCEQEVLVLEQDSVPNIQDIRQYIEGIAVRPGIQEYITAQEIDQELFVEHMIEKSQGNFIYLRYVLPEIERGVYKDLALAHLPLGLINYYQDQWQRMRVQNDSTWLDYKLPILVALTVVKQPVSINLLAEFSGIQDHRRIRSVLSEWQPFLYEQKVEYEGKLQKRYRMYHDSFRDFIASKDEVEGEHVNLKRAHEIISEKLWEELFGNDTAN